MFKYTNNIIILFAFVAIFIVDDVVLGVRRCRIEGKDIASSRSDSNNAGICCEKCIKNPDCKAFVYLEDGHHCYEKDVSGPLVAFDKGDVKGFAGVIEDVPQAFIDLENSLKSCQYLGPGKNINSKVTMGAYGAVTSDKECCEHCKNTCGCRGFSRIASKGTCFLEYVAGPITDNTNMIGAGLIQMLPSSLPCTPNSIAAGFGGSRPKQMRQGYDITPGSSLISTPSVDADECDARCSACLECHGFVYDQEADTCHLKSTTNWAPSTNYNLVAGIFL